MIAKQYGKSLAYVSNTFRLLALPSIIQEGLISNTISEGHARALLMIKSTADKITVYRKILLEKLNVRETEKLAREVHN
jgi:ParB family chromosome partitioning protein